MDEAFHHPEGLEAQKAIQPGAAQKAPLALIRAMDEMVADRSPARRLSPLPFEEEGQRFWLVPVGLKSRANISLARQAGSRRAWFQRHVVLPERTSQNIRVKVYEAPPELRRSLKKLVHLKGPGGTLNFWVGHFDDGCVVDWDRTNVPSGRLRARSILEADRRAPTFRRSLANAVESRAHVVVFPELSLEPNMSREADLFLGQFLLLVPGSFHEVHDSEVYNVARLCDGCTGGEIFAHRKLRVFGRTGEGGEPDLAEGIGLGDTIHVLVTDAGCFTLLICKDFLDLDASVATLLQEVPVDWVLVPSYGDQKTLDAHKRKARSVATIETGSGVAVANIRNLRSGEKLDLLPGFLHQPGERVPVDVGAHGGMVACKL